MSGHYESQPHNTRSRKRRPKWQRMLRKYWPPIRFGLICLLLLLLIIGFISLLVNLFSTANKDKTTADTPDSSTSSIADPIPSDSALSVAHRQAIKQYAFSKANELAVGYDYQGAIELLKSIEFYDEVPEIQDLIAEYTQLDSQLVSYDRMDNITHVFFHSLIVDVDRAFDSDYTNGGYNQYMTTIDEFITMMESMYERGYVLVSPYDVAYEVTDSTGTHFVYGDIRLPEGKIPFIMSQDDVNYYGYMIGDADPTYAKPAAPTPAGDGFAHKLVIGEDGYPTCEYMDAEGKITFGDYDLVPVLERFIQEHPDFSYRGARAMLGVTGYEGVLGYRTKPSYEAAMGTEAYAAEVQAAKDVAQCLKDHGWLIVSHSYGHPAYGNINDYRVAADSDRWETTVQPIVGETDIILYPHGSDIHTWHKYPATNGKFQALYADGYRYFFNVDSSVHWNQMGDNYFRGGRRNLDGFRMYYNPELLEDLFDVESVFDKARPTPVPNSGWGM